MLLDRAELSAALLERARSTGLLVGDQVAPREGGWSEGMPGTGEFTAYAVMFTGAVQVKPSALLLSKYDATARYSFRCFGVMQEQAEEVSLRLRTALSFSGSENRFDIGTTHRCNLVWCESIGSLDRIDDANPKYWRIVDSYAVECVALR